jgi:glycosyltransferase involved in cell wall biosynthesis
MSDSKKDSINLFYRIFNRVRYASLTNNLLRILPSFMHTPIQDIRYKFLQPGLSPLQEMLLDIIQKHNGVKSMIVFPPSLDWSTQLFQRPQQMALALAGNDALIFYLQHRENWDEIPFTQIQPYLYLCNVPVETFRCLEGVIIYIFTWNKVFQTAFMSPRIIYDYVDDIRTFPGNHSGMLRDHQQLLKDAELILITAQRLYEEVLPKRPDAVRCPNGVNYDHFVRARHQPAEYVPEDIRPLFDIGNPIVGYYGALAKWLDYDLMECISAERRDLTFILIGPDYDNTLPDSLLDQVNVHWLGMKPYQELPDYLRHFDVAIIPFRLTDITHATSPIKLFEYFAAGKPIVTTAMQESAQYPGVLVSENCHDFTIKLDQALKLRSDPDYLELSDRIARQNTWDMRARQILEVLTLSKS